MSILKKVTHIVWIPNCNTSKNTRYVCEENYNEAFIIKSDISYNKIKFRWKEFCLSEEFNSRLFKMWSLLYQVFIHFIPLYRFISRKLFFSFRFISRTFFRLLLLFLSSLAHVQNFHFTLSPYSIKLKNHYLVSFFTNIAFCHLLFCLDVTSSRTAHNMKYSN